MYICNYQISYIVQLYIIVCICFTVVYHFYTYLLKSAHVYWNVNVLYYFYKKKKYSEKQNINQNCKQSRKLYQTLNCYSYGWCSIILLFCPFHSFFITWITIIFFFYFQLKNTSKLATRNPWSCFQFQMTFWWCPARLLWFKTSTLAVRRIV